MSGDELATTGRDEAGRFVKGCPPGPGNPGAKAVARFRAAMLEAVTEDDVRAVVRALVEQARGGNVPAIREFLERVVGRVPLPAIEGGEAGEGQRIFVVVE